ncbi:MAG: outer membrane protein assembly factor BamD [Rhizobiaceae bacterium]|nr:outer membrane protein assembly factor BamD [Rhizobiaceae bacterium]
MLTEIQPVKTPGKSAGKLAIGLASFAILLSACAKEQDVNAFIDPTVPADQTYNEALANIDAGKFTQAKRKFKKLDRQHPYSEYAKRSGVMSTFIAYRQGDYAEAIAQGKRFVQLYPANAEAPYAQYLVGMSHYRQISDVTRDQRSAKETFRAMNVLIERYPDSEYVEDAKRKKRIAKDQLAGQEMLVGRYYQERSEFLAAINRYRGVVEQFEDTRHVEEALARLTESYFALGLTSDAQTAAAVLGHNFPDSKWYRDSYALLEKGGLRPLENRGSWLSRASKLISGA